ncbi:hypothetical protein R6Q59_027197 [Mikania micrantha]
MQPICNVGKRFSSSHATTCASKDAFESDLKERLSWDDFVWSSACYSLRMPAIFSAKLAEKVLGLLMDVLNDDSVVVRLGALETMHHIAVSGHLKVQEMHMHMVNFWLVLAQIVLILVL